MYLNLANFLERFGPGSFGPDIFQSTKPLLLSEWFFIYFYSKSGPIW